MAGHDPSAPALFEIGAPAPAPSTTRATSSFMDLEDPRYAYMFGFLQADGHLAPGTGRKGRRRLPVPIRQGRHGSRPADRAERP
ncbi:protein of unknown function [Streptomyces sp. KY75]|nr:protein of unknown function [Streptomyces sp. KY75]CAD5979208.1 protein of unknown function [Streptomyces sp. KY70]